MRILIADDNAQLRRVLRQVIEAHEGWTVCCEAQDGLDAVEQAKQCKPDLVLLDLAMPHISGLAAARRISQLLPGVPILMHTLYDNPHLQVEAKKNGVQQIIPKSEGHALISALEAYAKTVRSPEVALPDALPPPATIEPSTETSATKEQTQAPQNSTPHDPQA